MTTIIKICEICKKKFEIAEEYSGNTKCRDCYKAIKNGYAPHQETITNLTTPSRNEVQEHIDKTSIFKSLCVVAKKGSKGIDIARETQEIYKLLFL